MSTTSSESQHQLDITHSYLPSQGRLVPYSDRRPKDPQGSPVLLLEGTPAVPRHKEELLNWVAAAGYGRRVVSMEHPSGLHPGRERLVTIESFLKYVQNRQKEEGKEEAAHVVGHSLGGAEAVMLVSLLLDTHNNKVEAVRKIIKSLTLINSAGLTDNSWGIHMKNFYRTLMATFSLPEPERTLQKQWILECFKPRNALRLLKDIGYIMELTRRRLDARLAKIIGKGFPVLLLQAKGDTLIPPALLREKIREHVYIEADMGNHLGILADPVNCGGEKIIQHLDRVDNPQAVLSSYGGIEPFATG